VKLAWPRLSASGIGLVLGTLFFAASLTPSMIPRSSLVQGALAGACLAIGYGLGLALRWLWNYLELPQPQERLRRQISFAALIPCLAVALLFLWRSGAWQDSVRTAVGMEPVAETHALTVCAVAIATFAVLCLIALLFGAIARWTSRTGGRFVPRRIANAIGIATAILLFWSLATDVLGRAVFRVLDSSYAEFNALIEPERPQPTEPNRTGGPESLIDWVDLGRAGREFIAGAPTAADISAVTGRPAIDPVRVYAGLPSGRDYADRAALALAELKRVGGFERSRLVVVTPTGTGWVDPSAMLPIEFLGDGNVASVAMQYSYLSSPLSLLAQPDYGAEAARALFAAVYGYWTTLPRQSRPRLYLHGLSLGAMNSEKSVQLFEMIGDPIDGALWSGPPFESRIWRDITAARNAGTPQWLPEFRDGSLVRFMNQNGSTVPADRPWGLLRVVYLQYASDAIVFFDYADLYRPPAWMAAPRGPDVSPKLTWYPVVTMLQIAIDMGFATVPPMGTGHVYAPEHYTDAWIAVAAFDQWRPDEIARLKAVLSARLRPAVCEACENRGG